MKNSLSLLALLALPCALSAEPVSYTVDPVHSSVNFKVRHLVSKVTGSFGEFSGKIILDEAKPEASSAVGEIKVVSVGTGNAKRDAHLQGGDFFKAEQNPTMTFKSTAWKKSAEPNTYEVTGDLAFAGATKPVTLKLVHTGTADNPMTKGKVGGFEATAKIDRTQWGMTYGKGMIGDEVEISIQIEASLDKPAAAEKPAKK